MSRFVCAATLALAVPGALGHGSMIMPPARNSVDSELPAWSKGKHPMTGVIQPYSCACTNGTDVCNSGQSCFWFSQGCSIGCSACDGNGSRIPNFDHCPEERKTMNLTAKTILPKYRTTNIHAEWGTITDIWRFNPWRAPGTAPVFDACGKAGGSDHQCFNAGEFNETKFAKIGDLGSKVLPKRPTGTVWKRGGVAAVRWELTAAHGGGYQFRLCPAGEALTEECFQRTPLEFASPNHTVRYADASKDHEVPGTIITEGGGQGWMLHPLPYATSEPCDMVMPTGKHCSYPCERCGAPWYAADGACPVNCAKGHPELPNTTDYGSAIPAPNTRGGSYSIENTVRVPSTIPPGEYVLGYRWDCEATSQVWASCADITIA